MVIEIWSDIACPWCYIGKTRFEAALQQYEHKDAVQVVWRSYELQPNGPKTNPKTTVENLMEKYGRSHAEVMEMMANVTEVAAGEGLEYHLDKALAANTFDAHRLIHLASERGLGHAAMTRFMQAYQSEGENLADEATLVRLAIEAGLEEQDVRRVLGSDEYAAAVRADEQRARSVGVNGVPFFVIDEAHGISGAQPTEFFLEALRQLGPKTQPVTLLQPVGVSADGSCTDDGCEVPSA